MNHKALSIATRVMIMTIVISVILLFLGISVLVLIHICIVGGTFRRFGNDDENNNSSNISNSNAADRGSLASTSMSRDDIEKLPSFDFRDKIKGSSPVDCSVCLENFKSGDKCRLLPICKHSFHAHCVDMWLLKTPFCPICRTNNGAWRVGSLSGEESSLFSESGHLNEFYLGQSGHFGEVGLALGDSQTRHSEQLNEIVVELGENHIVEIGDFSENLSENAVENGHFGEVQVKLSDIQTRGSHLGDIEPGKKHISESSNNTVVLK